MAARAVADLSARARIACEAADDSYQVRVPKETKEWAETAWWKCEGPEPGLIPGKTHETADILWKCLGIKRGMCRMELTAAVRVHPLFRLTMRTADHRCC